MEGRKKSSVQMRRETGERMALYRNEEGENCSELAKNLTIK